MLADLWHAPHAAQAVGTATTGSSEAIQLGGLAMKRIWQEKRKAAGKSIHEPGPNIVMGSNAQVALEKLVLNLLVLPLLPSYMQVCALFRGRVSPCPHLRRVQIQAGPETCYGIC